MYAPYSAVHVHSMALACTLLRDGAGDEGALEGLVFRGASTLALAPGARATVRIEGSTLAVLPEGAGGACHTLVFRDAHDALAAARAVLAARFEAWARAPSSPVAACSLSAAAAPRTLELRGGTLRLVEAGEPLLALDARLVAPVPLAPAVLGLNGVRVQFASPAAAHRWRCLLARAPFVAETLVGWGGATAVLRLCPCHAEVLVGGALAGLTPLPHTTRAVQEGRTVAVEGLGALSFADVAGALAFAALVGAQTAPGGDAVALAVDAGGTTAVVRYAPERYPRVLCMEALADAAALCGLDAADVDLDVGGTLVGATPLLPLAALLPHGGHARLAPPGPPTHRRALALAVVRAVAGLSEH